MGRSNRRWPLYRLVRFARTHSALAVYMAYRAIPIRGVYLREIIPCAKKIVSVILFLDCFRRVNN